MKTPHINAENNEIAKTVIMPGDPLRAQYIAEKFLDNYKKVNDIRNMFAFTGFYKGKKVTIMGSGMGMASMGIYSYELYKYYDVDTIIRVGSCGSYIKDINVYDVILTKDSYSESTYAKVQNGFDEKIIEANKELNKKILKTAENINLNVKEKRIHSSDVFYKENNNYKYLVKEYNCSVVEMESFALFHNANVLNKKAACILTVSDSFITNEKTTSKERETKFNDMINLALESIK